MLDNFFAFIKGVLWGALMFVIFVIVIAILGGFKPNSEFQNHAAAFFAWGIVASFTMGIVNASSGEGFGILSLILFIVCLVVLYICSIAALVELDPKVNAFYGAITCGLMGATGALALAWYIIIGTGSSDSPIQMLPTLIVAAVVFLIIGWIWNASVGWAKGVSIALGVIGPVGIIVLRIKNGSALDY